MRLPVPLVLSLLLLVLPAAAQTTGLPSLSIAAGPFGGVPLPPRTPFTFTVAVNNGSDVPATGVVLTVSLPTGGRLIGVRGDGSCSIDDDVLTCTFDRVTRTEPRRVSVDAVVPDRVEGEPMFIQIGVRANEADANPADDNRTFFVPIKREITVTNTNDSGEGSLRAAIFEANARCLHRTPCDIAFQIEGVIQPLTPLPELAAEVRIDGKDRIEINGALVRDGGGLRVSPNCVVEIYGLAVTGFPGHAIDVDRLPADPGPEACYDHGPTLDVRIARNRLTGNLRGIGLRTFRATVEDNVISGNRRSGIFAGGGSYATIVRNRIESNGASGIFLDIDGSADVERNTIAGNDQWALARTPRGDVLVSENSIFGNGLQAIDIGLDLDTPANRPVLFWAIYDSVRGATVIRGHFDPVNPPFLARFFIELFASAGLSRENQPQAERSLVSVEASGDFEIAVAEDLRGKWITAASHTLRLQLVGRTPGADAHFFGAPGSTSELSNAVYVAP